MRAAFYDPYLDTLGGGERYMLTFAKALAEKKWKIYLEWNDETILKKLHERFGIDTNDFSIVPSIKRGDGYDLCFWFSDGSIPTLYSRHNILHFQRPFYGVDGRSLINRMKFFRINTVLVNSEFTKEWIDREYPQKSEILYPPVDIDNFKPGRKENIILAVGRFSELEQSKRQDVLVDVFKNMYDSSGSKVRSRKWRMVLAGGSGVGRSSFLDKIKNESKHYPISVVENPSFEELKKLYAKSKLFWTASGFGIDVQKRPEKVEHFGITTVEAMSAGCIPFAYDAGGHKESIEDGVNGYLWSDKEVLAQKTLEILTNYSRLKKIAQKATTDAQKFSDKKFKKKVISLVNMSA